MFAPHDSAHDHDSLFGVPFIDPALQLMVPSGVDIHRLVEESSAIDSDYRNVLAPEFDTATLGVGPLAGHKIVVSGMHVMKARFSGTMSAFGAEVIEIAPFVTRGDGARFVPPLYGDSDSYFYWAINSGGRENVALNLGHPEGRAIAYELLSDADVFFSNSTLKVLNSSQLTWDHLKEKFPKLVGVYASFAGLTGPGANRSGYHHTALAETGIAMLNSHHGPSLGAIPWIDHGAAGRAVQLAMAGVIQRTRTNLGTKMEVSLLEYAAETLNYHAALAWTPHLSEKVHVHAKQYDRHHTVPTLFLAECANGARVAVGAVMKAQVEKLFEALNLSHLLADERFNDAESRLKNAHAVLAIIHSRTRTMEPAALVELLASKGVPASQMRDIALVKDDPQLLHRDMIREVEGPDGKPIVIPGFAGRMGDDERGIHRPSFARARRYGEDTRKRLLEIGVSLSEIERMHNEGVVHDHSLSKVD